MTGSSQDLKFPSVSRKAIEKSIAANPRPKSEARCQVDLNAAQWRWLSKGLAVIDGAISASRLKISLSPSKEWPRANPTAINPAKTKE